MGCYFKNGCILYQYYCKEINKHNNNIMRYYNNTRMQNIDAYNRDNGNIIKIRCIIIFLCDIGFFLGIDILHGKMHMNVVQYFDHVKLRL